jgi:DNA-binding IclR family transcriptional regulator
MANQSSNTELDGRTQPRVQSVARGLRILTLVAESPEGLTAREIAAALDLRLPTAHHLVQTLVAEGFLMKDKGHRYRLGLRVGTLAEAFPRHLDPAEHLTSRARALAATTGEAAYLAGWRDGRIVIFAQIPGQHSVNVTDLRVGLAEDAHARASGKLLLAFADAEVQERFFKRQELRARTPATITERPRLEAEFEQIRSRGYALDREEFASGVCCLAALIDGSPIAISLSAPADRFAQRFDAYLDALLAKAGGEARREPSPLPQEGAT